MSTIIDDLKRKIDLQRGVHSFYEIRARRLAILTKVILIIFPALLTLAAFSDFNFLHKFVPNLTEEGIRLSIGIVSFILFVVGVLSEIFGVTIKHEKHREAIEQYSELRREFREAQQPISDEVAKVFNQRYIAISSTAIPLNSAKFGKAEKYHLKHQAFRKAVKENPFGFFFTIRKRASEIAKTNG